MRVILGLTEKNGLVGEFLEGVARSWFFLTKEGLVGYGSRSFRDIPIVWN